MIGVGFAGYQSAYGATASQKYAEARANKQKADNLYAQLGEAEKKITALQSQISTTEAEIAATQAKLEAKEAEMKKQQEALDERLAAMYKTGTVGLVDVILSSNNVTELITNVGMVQAVISHDQDVLKQMEVEYKEIDKLKQAEEEKQAKLEEDKKQLEAEKASIKTQADAYAAKESELNAEGDALAREAAAAAANYNNSGGGSSGGGSYSGGGYTWPVNGPITSPFGWRVHPIYGTSSFHNGVDIGAPTGTPIRATGSGRIIKASWYGGYGNCIMIDIGGGLSVLYGHLSAYAVSQGQWVSQGQVVGYVGTTGWSTGPHLHYSVFKNGVVVTPYSIY